MRLLVVDDDPVTSEALCLALSMRGHVAEALLDGGRVLDQVRDGAYDAVILDQRLPTLDGISVVQLLRQAGLDVAVLMATAVDAVTADALRQQLQCRQPATLVRKPATSEEMLAAIEALLATQ